MGKRQLGLGKLAKSKKQKKEESPEKESNELTVDLGEEVDQNDEFAQLKGLWKTYNTTKDNQLILNGIIHECDRLLRNAEGKDLDDFFHSIYALALAELAIYADEEKEIQEFFDAALERLDLGLQKHSESISLHFAKSKILLNQIPLQFISKLTVESQDDSTVVDKLELALDSYSKAEDLSAQTKNYDHFNTENLDTLQALDDLLDMVDNFGKDLMEGEESDSEEAEEVEISASHPLHAVRNSDEYNQWWRDHTITFLANVEQQKEADAAVKRELNKRLGQSYLQEAEEPSSIYATLAYDDGFKDKKSLNGLSKQDSQKIARELFEKALVHLQQAWDDEDTETWVTLAEAKISLGNLFPVDSPEQEKLYQEAEAVLTKANNLTNGKYQEVLDNLLE